MKGILFWVAFPFRVAWGMVRDEIEFYKLVRHYTDGKQAKDIEF